jgi:hypothetical protein
MWVRPRRWVVARRAHTGHVSAMPIELGIGERRTVRGSSPALAIGTCLEDGGCFRACRPWFGASLVIRRIQSRRHDGVTCRRAVRMLCGTMAYTMMAMVRLGEGEREGVDLVDLTDHIGCHWGFHRHRLCGGSGLGWRSGTLVVKGDDDVHICTGFHCS